MAFDLVQDIQPPRACVSHSTVTNIEGFHPERPVLPMIVNLQRKRVEHVVVSA